MKRPLSLLLLMTFALLLIMFALVVCGALLVWWALFYGRPQGSGGIGSVSAGIPKVLVVETGGIILVLAILAGRTLLIRYRNSRTARES